MKACSICKAPIESEEPSILTMGGYGNPRYVCECCDTQMDRMMFAKDPDEVQDAMKILGDHLARIGCEDNAVIQTMQEITSRAVVRAEAIRAGTYDFSEDASTEDEEEMVEIPEELQETEEDRALDEKEEVQSKKFDKIMNYAWGVFAVLFAAAFAYIMIRRFM